jgi:hypothetical protein
MSIRLISIDRENLTISIRTEQNLLSFKFELKKDMDEAYQSWVHGGDLMNLEPLEEADASEIPAALCSGKNSGTKPFRV